VHPNKSCPIVLRCRESVEILAFRHPLAGNQLVKGSIEPGELPCQAAVRELYEEAGVECLSIANDLGLWLSGYKDQIWSFHLCTVRRELPEEWAHRTLDDGGHVFEFFWQRLDRELTSEWHEVYIRAIRHIRSIDVITKWYRLPSARKLPHSA
jgi:8-oxo-dGTP pyrophosphatase MutT (NUDIX family)